MKLGLIKLKLQDLNSLLDYLKVNKIKNTALFMNLFDNLEILDSANKIIDKLINPELTELDKKAIDLVISYKVDKKNPPIQGDLFSFALSLLSKEDQHKRAELAKEYENDMNTDREVNLIPISRELLKEVDLEVDEYNKIRFFLDPKNWESDKPKKQKK
jgi:hypothetical protein